MQWFHFFMINTLIQWSKFNHNIFCKVYCLVRLFESFKWGMKSQRDPKEQPTWGVGLEIGFGKWVGLIILTGSCCLCDFCPQINEYMDWILMPLGRGGGGGNVFESSECNMPTTRTCKSSVSTIMITDQMQQNHLILNFNILIF